LNTQSDTTETPAFAWVSPYAADDQRGGWKSMQFHLLRALEARLGSALRIESVDVPEEQWGKWLSRVQKKLWIPRPYTYYSESRLSAFAAVVGSKLPVNHLLPVVFFGALPFVKCRPLQPYYIYTDGAFFIHYWEYNADHSHRRSDVERICRMEAEFMRGSAGVWCSSQWVADRITKEYHLAEGLARQVGTGPGSVPPPVEPIRHENFLLMIAGDFERKGGRLAVDSVAAARKAGADVNLKFIGAKPPEEVLGLPFVEWCGWLNPQKEPDRTRFAEILSRAGTQILLSRSDLTPLVIPEAASYSKATLATAVGGIPEMIQPGKTGWLTASKNDPEVIGRQIADIFKTPNLVAETGARAKDHCARHWSWEAVGGVCTSNMNNETTRA
jgi:glycosyltransferase involved in cell wall biosynthesis